MLVAEYDNRAVPKVIDFGVAKATAQRLTERTMFTEFGPGARDDAVHEKSLKHHTAMQALFVAWYDFSRKHEALKGQTPAMASKLTDHIWTIKELIERAAA